MERSLAIALILAGTATIADAKGDGAPPLDKAKVTAAAPAALPPAHEEPTARVALDVADPSTATPGPGDAALIASPGGDRLIVAGNDQDLAHPVVRAFDGNAWRALGSITSWMADRSMARPDRRVVVALADDQIAWIEPGSAVPWFYLFDGSALVTERIPIRRRCVIEAIAVDGVDVVGAGHCRRGRREVGLIVRRHDGRWIDERIHAPQLNAVAAGPAGLVAAGVAGTIVIREAEGWVVGSAGVTTWNEAAAGSHGTYLFAASERTIHELRGRVLTELPALPVPIEPAGVEARCKGDCSYPPGEVSPEGIRRIVSIAAAGGPLAVLAEVPGPGDWLREQTRGAFVWDGAHWHDAGRSIQTDNGDFVTRWSAARVIASDRNLWWDDQRVPGRLWP